MTYFFLCHVLVLFLWLTALGQSAKKRFFLFQTPYQQDGSSWDGFCRGKNMHLASIESEEEQQQVIDLLHAEGVESEVFIGMRIYYSEFWLDGQPVGYTNWRYDNTFEFSGYTAISPFDGLWTTYDDEYDSIATVAALCSQFGDPVSTFFGANKAYKCYESSADSNEKPGNSFAESQALCDIEGGVLASFSSRDELDSVKNSNCLGTSGNFWIGLSRKQSNTSYSWLSGETFKGFSNWAPGKPVLESDNQCVLAKDPLGPWFDVPCSLRAGRICMFIHSFSPSLAPTSSAPSFHPTTSEPTHSPSLSPSRAPTPPTTYLPSSAPVTSQPTMVPTHSPTDIRGRKTFYMYAGSWAFDQARSFCESKGMQLASILSNEERWLVSNMIQTFDKAWIGLKWTGQFTKWTDGSSVSYLAWNSVPPPSSSTACVFLYTPNGGFEYFRSRSCVEYLSFTACHEYDREVPSPQLSLPKYYVLFKNVQVNWFEARNYCMDRGLAFATILSAQEHEEAQRVLCPIQGQCIEAWIGMRRNQFNRTEFRWIDNTPAMFFPWSTGEPNDQGSIQDCVHFGSGVASWKDEACSRRIGAMLCQTNIPPTASPTSMAPSLAPTGTKSPTSLPTRSPGDVLPGRMKGYWVARSSVNLEQAETTCDSLRMSIATIMSDSEAQQAITSMTASKRSSGTAWIGLRKGPGYGNYTWKHDLDLTYTNWADNEPETSSSPRCVYVSDDGMWITTDCWDERDTLCEYDATIDPSQLAQPFRMGSSEDCLANTTVLKGTLFSNPFITAESATPIPYDLCTGTRFPWFQEAVAFKYEVRAMRKGNYTFTPMFYGIEQCKEPWLSVIVTSPSCGIFPNASSEILACATWALKNWRGSEINLTYSLEEREVINVYLILRYGITDDCFLTSGMYLRTNISYVNYTDRVIAWAVMMGLTLFILMCYWSRIHHAASATCIALLFVAEVYALIGYLAFAGVAQLVYMAMICFFFIPGVAIIVLYLIIYADHRVPRTIASFVWSICQVSFLLVMIPIVSLLFPHQIAPTISMVAPLPSPAAGIQLLFLTYASRLILFSIPMFICVIVNSVDLGTVGQWPFAVAVAISLALFCVYLSAIWAGINQEWSRKDMLYYYVVFGTSQYNIEQSDARPPPAAADVERTTTMPPTRFDTQTSATQPVRESTDWEDTTNEPYEQPVRERSASGDSLDEPDWEDKRRFVQQQRNDGESPEEAPPSTQSTGIQCGICVSSTSQLSALSCGHVICNSCLAGLRRERLPCPFCRKPIVSAIKLYL